LGAPAELTETDLEKLGLPLGPWKELPRLPPRTWVNSLAYPGVLLSDRLANTVHHEPSRLVGHTACGAAGAMLVPLYLLIHLAIAAKLGSLRRVSPAPATSITDLAEQEGVTDAYVCRFLPLTYLVPDICGSDPRRAAAEGAQVG
jgi:hypothetical protein